MAHLMRRTLAGLVLALPLAAGAQDLVQVYRDARSYDAQYAAARNALQAGLEKLPQGRALLLPTLNLTANRQNNRLENTAHDAANASLGFLREVRTYGYQLSFSQPIYRAQNLIAYDQAEYQVRQAEATYRQAEQDLILRTTRAYFDVLLAEVTLAAVRANKTAIGEQLAQAKRNFEVGTATITDTHEAQSRYDLATAQEIATENDLLTKLRALQQITGKEYSKLKGVRPGVELAQPNPNNMQSWVDLAEKQSFPVLIQEAVTEISSLEAKRNSAAHLPTLDLVGGYSYTNQTGSQFTGIGSDITNASFGVQLALPIYAGGGLNSREREAAANYQRSRQDLENARRSAALAARQAYLSVISGQAQVSALRQALVSSNSALDSNKLGYEVGVRINIDVLNAQQQVFLTQQNLAQAIYNTVIGHLQLKASAGSLRDEDVEEINRVLAN